MCYSKEVSLAVGVAMLAVSRWTYVKYVRDTLPEPPPATPPPSASGPTPLLLKPAFGAMVAAHVCIGLHQLFEFGALALASTLLYKVGLAVSMLSMLFVIRSLELLTRRSFASPLVATVIFAVAVWNATRPMAFENAHFWVRGQDHGLWGATWITLFLYWNVCLRSARGGAYSKRDAGLLRAYGWALLNVSFVVSVAYAYLAGLQSHVGLTTWLGQCIGVDAIAEGYTLLGDTPSLWCVFAGIQVLLLPFALRALRAGYADSLPPEPRPEGPLRVFSLAAGGLLLTGALYGSFPIVRELAERLVNR